MPRLVADASLSPQDNDRYFVVFAAERVPADFNARVAQVGGLVEASLDSIGAASVTGLSSDAASELAVR